jgi:AraC-like DNA-binding protein
MFILVGIIITFFLSALLLTKKDKIASDWILFTWLNFIGIHLLFYYLILEAKHWQYPSLLGLHFPIPLIHGPLLYLYTKSAIKGKKLDFKEGLHFLPFIVSYLLFSTFWFLPAETKIEIFRQEGKGFEIQLIINQIGFSISGLVYIALSLIALYKHKQQIQHQFSSLEKVQFDWLRNLIYGLAIIWIAIYIGNDSLIFSFVVIFVILIAYFGIKQVGIFTENQESIVLEPQNSSLTETEKYANSGLSSETVNSIHQQLQTLMIEEKEYRNPELTLGELAHKLGVHSNHLSQVINSIEGKSFFDYINHLRVEDFKLKVAQEENSKYTFLAIALECGFNSKTSFNRNFKKETGMSPSDYIKNLSS